MIERIGKESLLAREALRAAQRLTAERPVELRPAQALPTPPPSSEAAAGVQGPAFGQALSERVQEVDREVRSTESLPLDLLTGRIDDFHEIAVQLKSAELSFKFAMEIRNKLVDAYREIMRMSI